MSQKKRSAELKKRTLLHGKKVKESGKMEFWGFRSKCPEKWAHIDCETGLIFVWDSNRKTYKPPSKDIIYAAFITLCNYLLSDRGKG